MRLLHVEHPDGGGPGVFGDVARFENWKAWESKPPDGDFDALVLYGAATNIGDPEPWLDAELEWVRARLEVGVPMLGLCFGAQVIAAALGGPVVRAATPEIGWHPVTLTDAGRADPVLSAMGDEFPACQWHSYTFGIPPGGELLAASDVCAQAFRVGNAWACSSTRRSTARRTSGGSTATTRIRTRSRRASTRSPRTLRWTRRCRRGTSAGARCSGRS